MAAPIFTPEEFRTAFQALLPRGLAWPRDEGAVQTAFWDAMAPTYARQAMACAALLADAPPFRLEQLLPEWEATLGLPDPCAGPGQTVAQRVAQVVAQLILPGGQTKEYFLKIAEALGYENASIVEYAPFRADRSCADDPCGEEGWAFVWRLHAPELPVFYFSADISAADEPLYSLGADELRCTIDRYAPAHTVVLYSGNA